MELFLIKIKHLIRCLRKNYNKKFPSSPLCLNLGCGNDYKKGWVNIDADLYKNIKKLDLKCDLSRDIPFEDNSVDYIFNEHFLEHLSAKEGLEFLKECRRVLKPGGVLRISMPDLENAVKMYFDSNWREKTPASMYGFEVQTRAERINYSFRLWGHKWLYDREELERRLKEAGFQNIKFCRLRESEHAMLRNLETRRESTLIAEAGE